MGSQSVAQFRTSLHSLVFSRPGLFSVTYIAAGVCFLTIIGEGKSQASDSYILLLSYLSMYHCCCLTTLYRWRLLFSSDSPLVYFSVLTLPLRTALPLNQILPEPLIVGSGKKKNSSKVETALTVNKMLMKVESTVACKLCDETDKHRARTDKQTSRQTDPCLFSISLAALWMWRQAGGQDNDVDSPLLFPLLSCVLWSVISGGRMWPNFMCRMRASLCWVCLSVCLLSMAYLREAIRSLQNSRLLVPSPRTLRYRLLFCITWRNEYVALHFAHMRWPHEIANHPHNLQKDAIF